jgi:uncharacterized protein YqeY
MMLRERLLQGLQEALRSQDGQHKSNDEEILQVIRRELKLPRDSPTPQAVPE